MATSDEIDLLREKAQGLQFFILFRIPKEERKANVDMAKLAFLDREVIRSKFAPYLDYNAIDSELSKIRKKYQALPDVRFEQAKANAARIQQKEKLVA